MDMDLMVMEREMLSPVMDTESVTVLPLLLTIHMVAPALPTEAPRVFLDTAMVVTNTERDLLSPVMDMEVMDMAVLTAANTSPDHTPTMALMLLTLTKKDCQRKNVPSNKCCLDTSNVFVKQIQMKYKIKQTKK